MRPLLLLLIALPALAQGQSQGGFMRNFKKGYPRLTNDPSLLRILPAYALPSASGGCDGAAVTGMAQDGSMPAVTFTRASSASCLKGDGTLVTLTTNQPRVSSLGLNIEGSGTNLALRSQEFDNASWSKSGVTITANTTVAPDGTTTADTATADVGSASHRVATGNNIGFTSGVPNDSAVYVYTATAAYFAIQMNDTVTTTTCPFKTADWTVDALCGSSGVVTTYGNGWHRLSNTHTGTTTNAGGNMSVFLCDTAAHCGGSWTAAGTENAIIWQVDDVASAFPQSPIPTTTTSATRAVEVATVAKPALLTDATGCVGAAFLLTKAPATNDRLLSFTTPARFALGTTGGSITPQFNDGTGGSLGVANPATYIGVRTDAVATWTGATKTLASGGVTSSGSYDGAFLSDPINIGQDGSGGSFLNGFISNVRFGATTTACDY